MMQVGDQHQCQCKHCGKLFNPPLVTFVPAPIPPNCDHIWTGLSTWDSSGGQHGSRRCTKCGIYEQW
jgi:hypothetical protein